MTCQRNLRRPAPRALKPTAGTTGGAVPTFLRPTTIAQTPRLRARSSDPTSPKRGASRLIVVGPPLIRFSNSSSVDFESGAGERPSLRDRLRTASGAAAKNVFVLQPGRHFHVRPSPAPLSTDERKRIMSHEPRYEPWADEWVGWDLYRDYLEEYPKGEEGYVTPKEYASIAKERRREFLWR